LPKNDFADLKWKARQQHKFKRTRGYFLKQLFKGTSREQPKFGEEEVVAFMQQEMSDSDRGERISGRHWA